MRAPRGTVANIVFKFLLTVPFVWTVENLDAYLKNPRAVVNGGNMPFPGLPVEAQRKAIIAHLATFNEDGSRVSQ